MLLVEVNDHIYHTITASYLKHSNMAGSIHRFGSFLLLSWIVTFVGNPIAVAGVFRPEPWSLAHATFYGDETASATMGMSFIYHRQFCATSKP